MLGIRGGQLARERSCVSHCKMEADCGGLFVKVGVVVVAAFLPKLVLLFLWRPSCQGRRCCCCSLGLFVKEELYVKVKPFCQGETKLFQFCIKA